MSSFCTNNNILAVVPVRAGSKGLSNKNIRDLNGKPLFLHAVAQALRTVGSVLLSTDIPEIANMPMPRGCSVLWRPDNLADDDTPMESVIAHAITEQKLLGYTLVLLQATSPLRSDSDIQRAIELFKFGNYDLVMTVTEKDKSVLKYGTLSDGRYIPISNPENCFKNRQNLPAVYGPNGAVYVFGADSFAVYGGFPSRRIGVLEVPFERSIDIDSEDDFRLVERIKKSESAGLSQLKSSNLGLGFSS